MQSPVLSNRAGGRVAAIQPLCATIPAPPERAQTAQTTPKEIEDRNLIVVGELRLNDSVAPVYAIRADRRQRDSIARAVAMRIWWYFGSRLWPCAEPDNEW